MKIRPYQEEAIASFFADYEKDPQGSGLLYLATGAGKTVIASEIAKRLGGNKRTLFLCHREELAQQTISKFMVCWPGVDIGLVKAQHNMLGRQVTVASIQTVCSDKRLAQLLEYEYELVIVDECHHSGAATWKKVVNAQKCYKLGLTATPQRTDKVRLDDVFSKILYRYTIIDGIEQGYLCDIEGKVIQTEISLDGVKMTAGDFNTKSLSEIMTNPEMVKFVCQKWEQEAVDRKTVFFGVDIEHCKMIAAELRRMGYKAEWVAGEMKAEERAQTLQAFSRDKIQVLASCMLLTEGWDEPSVNCIAMARPTSSESLYCLDPDTEILTSDGWKRYSDEIKDVAAFDLKDGTIRWSSAIKIVRGLYDNEKFYGIENPGLSIAVTDKHNIVYRTRKSGWQLSTADNLPQEFKIPCAGNQNFPGIDLSDDEIRFIGLFMTDGSMNKKTNQLYISQSERHGFCIEYIKRVLESLNLKYGEVIRNNRTNFGERRFPMHYYYISKGTPRGKHKDKIGWGYLEKYISKDITDIFDLMNRDQLLVFLEALYIGDGFKKIGVDYNSQTYTICSDKKDFVDKLQSLCVRRGVRCNVSFDKIWRIYAAPNKSERSLNTSSSDTRPVFGIRNDINAGFVWCVQSETGAIVTRRYGKPSILGNCQMIGRGLRLYPDKENCRLLDFVCSSDKHRVMQLGILAGKMKEKEGSEKKAGGGSAPKEIKSIKLLISKDKEFKLQTQRADEVRRYDWIHTEDGLWVIGLGNQHLGYLVLSQVDDGWVIDHLSTLGWEDATNRMTNSPMPLDWCISMAEQEAERLADDVLKYASKDEQAWWMGGPTDKQKQILIRNRKPVPKTRKEASKMLNEIFFGWFMKKRAKANPKQIMEIRAAYYSESLPFPMTLERINRMTYGEYTRLQEKLIKKNERSFYA